jgi:hypothetical protein
MTSGRELRIGDAEREAAVTALGEHYAAGRLTKDEYDERADRANRARTGADLRPLFDDLPSLRLDSGGRAPAPVWPGRSRWPSWPTAGWAPVLLIVIGLLVLTHLPWPLLLIVGWIWWSRTFRHWRGHVRR